MKLKKDLLTIIVGFLIFAVIAIFYGLKSNSPETVQINPTSSVTHRGRDVSFRDKTGRHLGLTDSSNSLKIPTSQKYSLSESGNDCEVDCQAHIVKLLSSGTELSPAEAQIIIDNAAVFAPLLASVPESLAQLLVSLQKDEVDAGNIHSAAHAVRTALSDAERSSAGQSLFNHENPSFRALGIKLSEDSITHDANASRAFGALIGHEKDAVVLVTALNTLSHQETIGPYAYETLPSLNNLIVFHESDTIRGSALVAKAKTVQSTEDIRADIHHALSSPSKKFQEFGLQAYSATRARHSFHFHTGLQWPNDNETIKLLQALINDTDVDSELRQMAGELVIGE